MAQSKHTKKALLASGLSLLTCVALLIGSTFAWFTDSVTSGRNTITAGNLDVELYQVVNGDETPVTQDTNLFDDTALWEPGHVETIVLKIANEGTLALEYSLDVMVNSETPGINVLGDSFRLSDYIRLAAVDGNNTYANRDMAIAAAEGAGAAPISEMAAAKNGELYPQSSSAGSSEEYVTLIVYMPTTVGNEVNYRGSTVPSITLGISLTATQTPYEEDGFSDDYDDKAGVLQFTQAGEYTVDLDETPAYGNGDWGVVQAQGDGVTVNITGDGVVKAQESEDRYAMAVYAGGGGTVNIYGGYYSQEITGPDNQYDMIYADNGGYINIYGGTFKSETPKWTLNVLDSAYTNGTARITVYGGTFYKYNPAASQTEPGNGEPVSFVADGYTVVQDGDWYTVVEGEPVEDAAGLEEAIKEGKTVSLVGDIALDSLPQAPNGVTNIALNDHELTVDSTESLTVASEGELNISGGTLQIGGDEWPALAQACVVVQGGGSVTLTNVDYNAAGTGVFVQGEDATVKIVDSTVESPSFCVGTNAGKSDNYNVNIQIVNSELRSTHFDGWTGSAVLMNVPGNLTIENSTIIGECNAVIVRGGTATIKNSVLSRPYDVEGPDESTLHMNADWGSGNNVPLATLLLGNRSSNAYQYPTVCTVENTKITASADGAKAVYLYGNADEENGVTFTYNEDTIIQSGAGVDNVIYGGGYVSINGKVQQP